MSWPVYESYTLTPTLENISLRPNSQSWPIKRKFEDNLKTRYVLLEDKREEEMNSMWLIGKGETLAI